MNICHLVSHELLEKVILTNLTILVSSSFARYIGNHPFSAYAKYSKKLTFITPAIHTYVCVLRSKTICFSEYFAYAINE